MRVQAFADHFVIERGSTNRSYFALFVDGKPSWTRRIAHAQHYAESEKAAEGIELIKKRNDARAASCQCRQGHKDQIKNYPVDSRVVAITEINNNVGDGGVLPFGTVGRVSAHCNDGRAFVVFEGDNGSHTFHFPEQNIAAEWKPKQKRKKPHE